MHTHTYTYIGVTCVNTRLARYFFLSAHSVLAARDDCYACEREGGGEGGGREIERKSTLESTSKKRKQKDWRNGLSRRGEEEKKKGKGGEEWSKF